MPLSGGWTSCARSRTWVYSLMLLASFERSVRLALLPPFTPCRCLCRVLLHPQPHDPLNQVVRNRLIQGKLKVAFRPSVTCDCLLHRLVARNRWIKSDVLLPRSKVDQHSVLLECGHQVADRLLRFGRCAADRCPHLLQNRLYVRWELRDITVDVLCPFRFCHVSRASEAQILALVKRQPDLFNATLATVVPQQPSLPVENRIGLVNGVVVPLVLARTNDGVSSMTFPSGDAVLGTGNTDLCVVHVSKADVEHDVPVTLSNDLTGGNSIFLPRILRVGLEDGVVLVPGPFQAVVAGGVADSVGFILLPTQPNDRLHLSYASATIVA